MPAICDFYFLNNKRKSWKGVAFRKDLRSGARSCPLTLDCKSVATSDFAIFDLS